ncbi:maltotransferase domain-containing protein, partial [Bordetella pertussis]|uniref:maltotransferase domain-containing protein n=1 Tax=Bordetella pertussis TaxID=520 RepID=UPI000A6896C0
DWSAGAALLPAGVPRHLADPVEHCALYRGWHGVPLAPGDNDRWHARFAPRRVGLHEFRVCAWRDTWLTFCRELRLKHEADQDIALDLAEDAAHLRTALARRQARGDARPSKRPCPC